MCLSDNGKILKADCGFGLDDSKSPDALLLRCSDAEVGQDRASGVGSLTEYAGIRMEEPLPWRSAFYRLPPESVSAILR